MSTNTEQRLQQQIDELMLRLTAEREARQRAEEESANLYRMLSEELGGAAYMGEPAISDDLSKRLRELDVKGYQPITGAIGDEAANTIEALLKRAEAAEARIKASQEQDPCSFEVYNEDGVLYSASYAQACHEHINDAINEFEIEGAGKWRVRPVYTQPIIPPEVSDK